MARRLLIGGLACVLPRTIRANDRLPLIAMRGLDCLFYS